MGRDTDDPISDVVGSERSARYFSFVFSSCCCCCWVWFVVSTREDEDEFEKTKTRARLRPFASFEPKRNASVHVVDELCVDWLVDVDGFPGTWIAATV